MKKLLILTLVTNITYVYADPFMGRMTIDAIQNDNILGLSKSQQQKSDLNGVIRELTKSNNYNRMLSSYFNSYDYKDITKNSKITNTEAIKLKALTSGILQNYLEKTDTHNSFDSSGYFSNIRSGYQEKIPDKIVYLDKSASEDDGYKILYAGCSSYLVESFLTSKNIHTSKSTTIIVGSKNSWTSSNGRSVYIDDSFSYKDIFKYSSPVSNENIPNGGNPYCYSYRQSTDTIKSFLSSREETTEYRYVYNAEDLQKLNSLITRSQQFCTSKECYLLYGLIFTTPQYMSALIQQLPTSNNSPQKEKPVNSQALLNTINSNIKQASKSSYNLAFYLYGQSIAYACNKNVINKFGKLTTDNFNDCLSTAKLYNDSFNHNHGMFPYQTERYAAGINDAIKTINKYKPNVEQSNKALDYIKTLHLQLSNRGLISGDDYPEVSTANLLGY